MTSNRWYCPWVVYQRVSFSTKKGQSDARWSLPVTCNGRLCFHFDISIRIFHLSIYCSMPPAPSPCPGSQPQIMFSFPVFSNALHSASILPLCGCRWIGEAVGHAYHCHYLIRLLPLNKTLIHGVINPSPQSPHIFCVTGLSSHCQNSRLALFITYNLGILWDHKHSPQTAPLLFSLRKLPGSSPATIYSVLYWLSSVISSL